MAGGIAVTSLVVICFIAGGLTFDIANETKLRLDLLSLYNRRVRPEPVTTVNLIFNLLTINELTTKTQTFSVSGYFTMVWRDRRLSWSKMDYNGIGFIFGDETELWRPALVVKNAVSNLDVIANVEIPFRVLHSGTVFWNPPGIFDVHCDLDITYYPFDVQTCTMTVQSWGYNLRELDLIKYGSGVETGEYSLNGEWNLLASYSERSEKVDSIDAESYASVSFVFKLQRKADYYGINIILPVVVMSILSAFVFLLPADSGEKMGFSLTVLLAFAVFLTLIADRMPSTSQNTSYMAVYLSIVLCMTGLSVFLAIMVLDFHFRETEVPKILNHIMRNIIQPFLCMRSCKSTSVSHSNTNINSPKGGKVDPNNVDWQEGRSRSPIGTGDESDVLTWKEISKTFDALFFRLYMTVIVFVNVICFSILGAGGETAVQAPTGASTNTTTG